MEGNDLPYPSPTPFRSSSSSRIPCVVATFQSPEIRSLMLLRRLRGNKRIVLEFRLVLILHGELPRDRARQ
ncbi:hypothetical protein P8452_44580 [Trifolium repens]|nr:hypothetical protein P8452_44580 [Trifolium repens]